MYMGKDVSLRDDPTYPPSPFPPSTSPKIQSNRQEDVARAERKSTILFTVGTLFALALTAQTIQSTRRARQAGADARAWKKVSMTIMSRGHHPAPRSSHLPRYDEGMRGRGWDDFNPNRELKTEEHHNASIPSAVEEVAPAAVVLPKTKEAVSSTDQPGPRSSSLHPLYSAIHPHEDWDWTPADHPKPRKPWKKSRLPPWTVGFTSTPRTQSHVKSEAEVVKAPLDLEERLLHSAIWPDSDPLKSSEVAFIADEIFKDLCKRVPAQLDQETKKFKTPTKQNSSSSQDDSERVKALERQVWALLARSQALEDKLRKYQ